MTDKTYTQKEVDALIAAERDAVLREAADKANTEQFHDFVAKGAALTIRNQIRALIDQPPALDDALAAAKAEGVRECIEALSSYDPLDSATDDPATTLQALLPTDEQS